MTSQTKQISRGDAAIFSWLANHPRVYLIPICSFTTGFLIGVRRGARLASLRFLAENAHRAPRTLQGWYLYKKTKNYHVMWNGLKRGCNMGFKISVLGCLWVTIEELCREWGPGPLREIREAIAGVGTATAIIVARTRMGSIRMLGMGAGAGAVASGLRHILSAAGAGIGSSSSRSVNGSEDDPSGVVAVEGSR